MASIAEAPLEAGAAVLAEAGAEVEAGAAVEAEAGAAALEASEAAAWPAELAACAALLAADETASAALCASVAADDEPSLPELPQADNDRAIAEASAATSTVRVNFIGDLLDWAVESHGSGRSIKPRPTE
jgi:hypothetical protein